MNELNAERRKVKFTTLFTNFQFFASSNNINALRHAQTEHHATPPSPTSPHHPSYFSLIHLSPHLGWFCDGTTLQPKLILVVPDCRFHKLKILYKSGSTLALWYATFNSSLSFLDLLINFSWKFYPVTSSLLSSRLRTNSDTQATQAK